MEIAVGAAGAELLQACLIGACLDQTYVTSTSWNVLIHLSGILTVCKASELRHPPPVGARERVQRYVLSMIC